MRHVRTLIAALVIAPSAWILMAFGQDRSAQAFANGANGGTLHSADFFRPLLFLAAAGVLLGLIATLRFSPLGAVVAGVAYTAAYAALLVAPGRVLDLLNHHLSVAGHSGNLSTPLRSGSALLVGSMLLVATVSLDRWRRWPRPTEAATTQASEASRPVGIEGLGLNRPFDDLGPTRTSDGTDASRTSTDLDTEMSARYPSAPRVGAGSTHGSGFGPR